MIRHNEARPYINDFDHLGIKTTDFWAKLPSRGCAQSPNASRILESSCWAITQRKPESIRDCSLDKRTTQRRSLFGFKNDGLALMWTIWATFDSIWAKY